MTLLLEGKVAVITGAGAGIGKATARVFVREGASIAAVDFSGAEDSTAADLGPAVVPFHCDVSKEDRVAAMMDAVLETFGRVDAVLNIAGTMAEKTDLETTADQYQRMMEVNLWGVALGMKYGIRAMLASAGRGAIVNVSSVGGLNAEQRAPSMYSAAKAGVHALTKAAAVDYGPRGIRANAIAAGITLTEMMEAMDPETMAEMSAKPALERMGRADEPAEVAAFLCSDRASYVTGAVIPVDGGWSAKLA